VIDPIIEGKKREIMKIDLKALRLEMRILAAILRNPKLLDVDVVTFDNGDEGRLCDDLRSRFGYGIWGKDHKLALVKKRFTKLCAFRATLRRRLHFSPSTNLAEARWILGVPCIKSIEFRFSGPHSGQVFSKQRFPYKVVANCKNIPFDKNAKKAQQQECLTLYRFKTIDYKVQRDYVADLFEEFAIKEVGGVEQAVTTGSAE